MTFTSVILALCLVATIFLVIIAIRNQLVYNYYKRAIDLAYNLSMADIEKGIYNSNWFSELRKVDYYDMVLHFWKPIDSFYPPELRPKKDK